MKHPIIHGRSSALMEGATVHFLIKNIPKVINEFPVRLSEYMNLRYFLLLLWVSVFI